jgi:hypothetical protein
MENLNQYGVSLLNSMNRNLDRPVVCESLAEAVAVAESWGAREGRDLHIANCMGVVAVWSPDEGISYKVASHKMRHRSCWGF